MTDKIPILSISVFNLENPTTKLDSIDFLLIDNEEIELFLTGNDISLWFSNKRIIILLDNGSDQTLHTYPYTRVNSFMIKLNRYNTYTPLKINVNNDNDLEIKLYKSLPIKEIANLLSSKIL